MTTLRLGVAKVDITPDWPLPLAGFAVRSGLSEGVAQPLHLRVALLESDGPEDSNRGLVAAADLLKWGPERVPALRAAIANRHGVPEDRILLAATHSHSGPLASTRYAPAIGLPDPRYLEFLDERLLAAVDEAAANLEPVTIERARGEHHLGVNRRTYRDGLVLPLPNPDAPVDPELTYVGFRRPDGSLKAAFVHYTCHPVISTDNLLSGEFPGVAMSEVERETGAASLFLQGFAGDINPRIIEDGKFVRAHDDEIVRRGRALAAAVLDLVDGLRESLAPTPIDAETLTVALPFARVPTQEELQTASQQPGVTGEWGRAMLAEPARVAPTIDAHLQRLDIAGGLSLLGVDAEVVVEYGLYVKALSRGHVLPVGYCHGSLGYIPTARQLAEGGYEADGSTPYLLLPSRFAPEIEELMRAGIARLIES